MNDPKVRVWLVVRQRAGWSHSGELVVRMYRRGVPPDSKLKRGEFVIPVNVTVARAYLSGRAETTLALTVAP